MYILIIIGVFLFLCAMYFFRPKEIETPQEPPKQFGKGLLQKDDENDIDLSPPGSIPGINC